VVRNNCTGWALARCRRKVVLRGIKITVVLFPLVTATIIARIASVVISSVLIARGIIAIIAVDVFPLVARRIVHAVVIVGSHFFFGVRIINQRSRVCFGSEGVRRFRSARHSENAERQAEQERKKSFHSARNLS
jgi:hypothetical protein